MNKFSLFLPFIKRYKVYIASTLLFFSIGILFFLINRRWLLIEWVSRGASLNTTALAYKHRIKRKKITFYYWKDGVLRKEQTSLALLPDKSETLKMLIGNFLSFLYEERITEKTITIDSVVLTESGQEAYCSFSQPFLGKDWSIDKKWKIINGLLHTLAVADLQLHAIRFCVNHIPMQDEHLDFSKSWFISEHLDPLK